MPSVQSRLDLIGYLILEIRYLRLYHFVPITVIVAQLLAIVMISRKAFVLDFSVGGITLQARTCLADFGYM